MSRESVLFGVAGIFFGVLIGWIIGSQQAVEPRRPAPPAAETAAAPVQRAVPLDEPRAAELRRAAEANPRDAAVRVQLANMYFDAERFEEAARWYEAALEIDPRNADASTDLGIAYYYTNQPDRALAQFDRSLAADPNHSKTLLNIGIVRAFAKQDLRGAADAWQRVVDLAPDTPEARAARQALEGLRNAHPEMAGEPSGGRRPGTSE